MKTRVLLLGCLLALSSQAQTRREVYEWKDADGVKHYSDYPQPGARKIILNGSPTSTSSTTPVTSAPQTPPAQRPAVKEVVYDRLQILSPENGASFFDADPTINVRIEVQPGLAPTHQLLTFLDGKQLPGENTTTRQLTGVARGVHSLICVIVSPDGKELMRSESVAFNLKQPTVTNPRNLGPAVRPPQPKGG